MVKEKIIQYYADVFAADNVFPPMVGDPMKIVLSGDAVPFCLTSPRIIPVALQQEAKAALDTLLAQDIIEKLETPSPWSHPMVVVRKRNGKARICVDLTRLNKYVQRPIHPVPSPTTLIAGIPPGGRYFSHLDATTGFSQVPLAKESRPLTAFITPWGRFQYKRAPLGLKSAGDEYNIRTDKAFILFKNIFKMIDDLLAVSSTLFGHVKDVLALLETCRAHSFTLGREKFQFAQEQVSFCLLYTSDAADE